MSTRKSSKTEYQVMLTLSTKSGERKHPGDRVVASDLKVPIDIGLIQGVVAPIKPKDNTGGD